MLALPNLGDNFFFQSISLDNNPHYQEIMKQMLQTNSTH